MFERIVLAVDGSSHAAKAVETGTELAGKFGSEITVVHVRAQDVGRGGAYDLETQEEARELVDRIVRSLKDAGISARGDVRRAATGHVAHEILAAARDADASAIVMGTRGLSDWEGLLVGSVAHKVLHLSDLPVLVVR